MENVRASLARPVRFSIVLLMLVGYMFMALLVVEQNHVIQSQRTLIQTLFGDSTMLTSMQIIRMKELREQKQQQQRR